MENDLTVAPKAFDCAAARFRAEHNRLPVLVLDNVNLVTQGDLGLLYDLQQKAKTACDDGLYKVVFVCSDGVAPRKLRAKSKSRQLRTAIADTAQRTPRRLAAIRDIDSLFPFPLTATHSNYLRLD